MGEPVKKPILYGGRFVGLNREYSGEYSFGAQAARLDAVYMVARGSARRGVQGGSRLGSAGGLNGSNMVRVWLSRRLPLGAWANSAESSGDACGLPPSPMKLILAAVSSSWWDLHWGMIKTCFWQLWKFGYTRKLFCFPMNEALIPIVGGRSHWWWLWNTQRG